MTANYTCLIVDDDPFQHKLLRHHLQRLGATRIATCASATELLERLDRGDGPDLLLLDLNLPEMDGIEVLRHLARRHYRGHLILVSGEDPSILTTATHLARAHHLQVLGSAQKPVSEDALASLLRCGLRPLAAHSRSPRRYSAASVATALEEGQLCGFYQPKVRIGDGKVVGIEYLVRWRHPEDGLIFPDAFVPVAEAHGLVGRLTAAVLDDGLRQLSAWRNQGLALDLAINVSMDDLTQPAFADQVLRLCREHNVPPERLTLEVTESRLEGDPTTTLEILGRLRLGGLKLSLDDFGTGHSSLTRLRDLPFAELKIDRSFTHRAWKDRKRRTLFETSLEMGRRLGLQVVAEGVEDTEDWRFLESCLHPDLLVQGYHIARPMPADALPRWLENRPL